MLHSPRHHPPHLFIDDKIYFITCRTANKEKLFNNLEKKTILKRCVIEAQKKFNVKIFAWVILENHYHLLIQLPKGKLLPDFIKIINGRSSFLINKTGSKRGRKIWYNYWDYCIRSKTDFWKHFNYIHSNPIKHSYVRNADQLEFYKFSSYNEWVRKNGREWLASCFALYPIIDFSLPGD